MEKSDFIILKDCGEKMFFSKSAILWYKEGHNKGSMVFGTADHDGMWRFDITLEEFEKKLFGESKESGCNAL